MYACYEHTHPLTHNTSGDTHRDRSAQAHALPGHGLGKLLRVPGLLQQGPALRVEAMRLSQGTLACLQDEAAELGNLQFDLEDRVTAHESPPPRLGDPPPRPGAQGSLPNQDTKGNAVGGRDLRSPTPQVSLTSLMSSPWAALHGVLLVTPPTFWGPRSPSVRAQRRASSYRFRMYPLQLQRGSIA